MCSQGILKMDINQLCNASDVHITCYVVGLTTPMEDEIRIKSLWRPTAQLDRVAQYEVLSSTAASKAIYTTSLFSESFQCLYTPRDTGNTAQLTSDSYPKFIHRPSSLVVKPHMYRPEFLVLRWTDWFDQSGWSYIYSAYACPGDLHSCSTNQNFSLASYTKCHGLGECFLHFESHQHSSLSGNPSIHHRNEGDFYGFPFTFYVRGSSERDGLCVSQTEYTSAVVPCFEPVVKPTITDVRLRPGANKTVTMEMHWKVPTANRDIRCQYVKQLHLSLGDRWFTVRYLAAVESELFVVPNLRPAAPYTIALSYTNSAGYTSPSAKKRIITGETEPDDAIVSRVLVLDTNLTLQVFWSPSVRYYGPILGYELLYSGRTGRQSRICPVIPVSTSKEFSCIVRGFQLLKTYKFMVLSNNSVGTSPGLPSSWYTFLLNYTAPGPVEGLSWTSTRTSIYLTWSAPYSNGGRDIIRYEVDWSTPEKVGGSVPVPGPASLRENAGVLTDTGSPSLGYNLTLLHPGTYHLVVVRAVSQGEITGPLASVKAYTRLEEISTPPSLVADPSQSTGSSVVLRIPYLDNVGVYAVVVSTSAEKTPADAPCLTPTLTLTSRPAIARDCYLALRFVADLYRPEFTLGSGVIEGGPGVMNPALEVGQTVRVWLHVSKRAGQMSVTNYSHSTLLEVLPSTGAIVGKSPENMSIPVIVGVVCAVLLSLAILIGALYYFKFRLGTRYPLSALEKERSLHVKETGALLNGGEEEAEDDLDMSKQPNGENVYDNVETKNYDVMMYELKDFISQRKEEEGFRKEYMAIPWGLRAGVKCSTARKPENKNKNRYGNIIAYDHSRVELYEEGFAVDTDYINANYIDGYNSSRAYIATQGPTKITVNDFWRMVWQEKSTCIVMVTNLVELGRPKCDKYWSDTEPLLCGKVTVTLVDTKVLAYFTVRTLQLEKDEDVRTVRQFHFTAWPDHGVPSYPTALLSFVARVRSYTSPKDGPIISHCSAGVGRTGTYIALDSLLRQADLEGKIGVYRFVVNMRKQRCNMIQTLDQYIFLHEAILEAYYGMDTESTVDQFPTDYREMTTVNIKLKKSPLEDQYEKLDEIDYEYGTDEALSQENIIKNRNPTIVPYAERRVRLSNNEYINASFADDYVGRNNFIATQSPLANTVESFWRMVYENRVKVVVMLNGRSIDDESFVEYWPSEGDPLELTDHTVQLLSMKTVGLAHGFSVYVRTFEVKPASKSGVRSSMCGDDPRRYVEHYTCDLWPEDCATPTSREAFYDVVREMQAHRESPRGTVLVHCMDSARQTGLFIAAHIVLQQIEEDNAINVFEIVKGVRNSSPHFIACVDQYRFLYDLALDVISSGTDECHIDQGQPLPDLSVDPIA